jgi:SpoVK/Ycf46/Vps4 family AAA+-type ATPase
MTKPKNRYMSPRTIEQTNSTAQTVIFVGEGAQEPTINPAIEGYGSHSPKKSVSLKKFVEAGGLDWVPKPEPEVKPIYTLSQSTALELLIHRAEAYFSGLGRGLAFVPRFNSLLLAPTGSGKTKIARDLAKLMGAELFSVSISEWIVRGAQNEKSTISILLSVLKSSPKTVLLLDEIDKCTSQTDGAWTRSLAAEVWALLDRRLPPTGEPPVGSEDHEHLQMRLTNGMYIIGAGTFQRAWEQSARPTCGFNANASHAITDNGVMEAIEKSGLVSPELLSRFSPTPILLRYPTRSEVPNLLERLGLNRLASESGVQIDADSIHFDKCGLRVLEQLGAELIVSKIRQQRQTQIEALEEKIVRRPGPGSTPKR